MVRGKARFVEELKRERPARAKLYWLDPKMKYISSEMNEEGEWVEKETDYVVLSSVDNQYAQETMAFAAREDGEMLSWMEVGCVGAPGRFRELLERMGYEEVEEDE